MWTICLKNVHFNGEENSAKMDAFMLPDGEVDLNFQKRRIVTENELNVTATCITALANQPNSEEKIKLLLTSLFESYSKEGFLTKQKNTNFTPVSTIITFTQKEILKMDKDFKKIAKIRTICHFFVPFNSRRKLWQK